MDSQLSKAQSRIAELMTQLHFLENKQSIYIPKKNDSIDKALGKYLKNHEERDTLKILFIRVSDGVYQFGKKRVFIKIEKGSL